MKTICVKCKWHNGAPRSAVWYDHMCRHPEAQPKPYIDPVTGNLIQDERYCRDVNRGNCEYFEVSPNFLRQFIARYGQ